MALLALDIVSMVVPVMPADPGVVAASAETLDLSQLVVYVVTLLVGGGAVWKVLPILLARLSVALAGAKSERNAIERLESQLDAERKDAAVARDDANAAYRERNTIVRELGEVKVQMAVLAERATSQAQTIERQNRLISELSAKPRR